MKTKAYPRSRQQDIVMQNLDGEVLIYDLKAHKAFSLNETSALVWQECDGTKDIAQIAATIGEKLKKPASEDLVWLAIDNLNKENLLENDDELNLIFSGMSRRQVIKRIGLGTMIALPVVASLIAPTATMAGSPICRTDQDCAPVLGEPQICCFRATADAYCNPAGDGCGATN